MAFEPTFPQIPAGILANPSRNMFPAASINAPAGAALANSQNNARVGNVLDIIRQQNEMAGPLNQEAFRLEALSEALPEVRQLAQERGAEPFITTAPFFEALTGIVPPTGERQTRADEAFTSGMEADVLKTLSEANRNNAAAANQGSDSNPYEGFKVTFFNTDDPNAPGITLSGAPAFQYLQSTDRSLAQQTGPQEFVTTQPPPEGITGPTAPATEQSGGAQDETSSSLNLSPSAQTTRNQLKARAEQNGNVVVSEIPSGNGVVMNIRRPNGQMVIVKVDGAGRQQVLGYDGDE